MQDDEVRIRVYIKSLTKSLWHYKTVSNNPEKPNGSYNVPSPSKNLDMDSTQCNLNECNMADVPSMSTKMHTERTNHMAKRTTADTTPVTPVGPNAF